MADQQPENVEATPDTATELPALIYREALEEVVEEHFGSSHKECTITVDAGSSKGDNYIGVVYRVTVKHPTKDSLSVIVKLPPQNQARREQFHVERCFSRESQFYDTIFPLFKKFQQEKGIDVEENGFYEVAKCYKTLIEAPFEGLYFEDLKATGFDMFSRFKDTTADHSRLVMKVLGKFHAISFALKDQKPEVLAPYKEMQEVFWNHDDANMEAMQEQWFIKLKKQALDLVLNDENQDLAQRAQKYLEGKFFDMLDGCVTGALAEPYAVLCHGDCWNNNIMFREENGVPVEVRLLDWQVMRYASPVCDLMYYIFSCTTKELRDKHYDEFMNVYYESLSEFLARLGSDPTKVFPRSAFDDQLKRFGKFGLSMAIMTLPVFTSNPEDTPDMDDMAEQFKEAQDKGEEFKMDDISFQSEKTLGVYEKRMKGVWQDMHRLDYI